MKLLQNENIEDDVDIDDHLVLEDHYIKAT
jgi:hypothetical protein